MELFSVWITAIQATQNYTQYIFRDYSLSILSNIFHNSTEPKFHGFWA